ncbi:MAG TPA: hypothetical protein VME24_10970, partial [Alphaproteobacteria bacterium]|nr:hypothetical protein [Alphaproteobacteria bacterium]
SGLGSGEKNLAEPKVAEQPSERARASQSLGLETFYLKCISAWKSMTALSGSWRVSMISESRIQAMNPAGKMPAPLKLFLKRIESIPCSIQRTD